MNNSHQFSVSSVDGTELAVWVSGEGPPIVLVHGSFGDHTAWAVPVEFLNETFSVFAMDRRGFGASGDSDKYSIEDEFDDVASVVRAVTLQTGEAPILWGHSYGANCAMGGAARTDDVSHLVLYEPSFGLTYREGAIEAAEELLAAGDRAGAVELMLRDALDMSPEEISALKESPRWPNLLAGAHTAPRECRVEQSWVYQPGQFGGITAPTLMLSGSDSPDQLVQATLRAAEAIPGAAIAHMAGHGHFAHRSDPAMVIDLILPFVTDSLGSG